MSTRYLIISKQFNNKTNFKVSTSLKTQSLEIKFIDHLMIH